MRHIHIPAAAAFLGALLLSAGAMAQQASSAAIDSAMSYDGLQPVAVSGLDRTYVMPGASFAGYTSIQLDPVYVAFHKSWKPTVPGSRLQISESDRDRIRQQAATLVYDAFVKQLQSNGGYPVVNSPGPNVLRVKLSILNLVVTAPDLASSGRSRSWVASAGQATLLAEFYDSETGEILARVIDTQAARNTGAMTIGNSVNNMAEGRAIATQWAKILREGLDRSRDLTAAAQTAGPPAE